MSDREREPGVPPPGGGRALGKPGPSSVAGEPRRADLRAHAQRAWLLLLQVPLLLPFLTVQHCESDTTETLSGIAYYVGADRRALLVGAVLVVGLLLVVPWRGARGWRAAVVDALRAWVAVLGALLATLGPLVAFLFDQPRPRVGWWLHGGGWTLTALGCLGLSVQSLRAARRGADAPAADARALSAADVASGGGTRAGRGPALGMAGLLLVPIALVAVHVRADPVLAVGSAGVGLVVGAPLLLGGLALRGAAARAVTVGAPRAAWWAALVLTVLVQLGWLLDG